MIEWMALLVSIIAIIFTGYQILLSNKQLLFDRRMRLYEEAKSLYELWRKNRGQLLNYSKNTMIGSADVLFIWLTNNGLLYEIGTVIKTLLEDDEKHKKFLLKMEEMERMGDEINFTFGAKQKRDISSFVQFYSELLRTMVQYEMALRNAKDYASRYPEKDIEETLREFHELQIREKLINKAKKLDDIFQKVEKEKSFDKMRRQINLFIWKRC